jgi:hypothetical protein
MSLAAGSRLVLFATLMPLTGCVGDIGTTGETPIGASPSGGEGAGATTGPSTGTMNPAPAMTTVPGSPLPPALAPDKAPPAVTNCADVRQRGVARPGARRLSRAELVATLADIFGTKRDVGYLEKDLANYPEIAEMNDVTKFETAHTFEQAMAWAIFVDDVIGQKFPRELGGVCFTKTPITDQCWTDFFTNFGRTVWRRPLTSAEVDMLSAAVKGQPTTDAVYTALSMLFRAPEFLFHIENGTSQDGAHARLTSHEIANRISYGTIGSMPDKVLADAADAGQLATLAQVEAQVRRLIETPRAKTKLLRLFAEWLNLEHVLQPDPAFVDIFLRTGLTNQAAIMFKAELLEYAGHVIWTEKGTFKDLMTRKIAFPRHEGMRMVFEAPTVLTKDVVTPVAVPYHAGLLLRPAMLLNSNRESSPILRGALMKRRVLCDQLKSPDFAAVAQRFDELGDLDPNKTPNWKLVEQLTAAPQCQTCHKEINPMGFAFEEFNSIGMHRTDQIVYKDPYTILTRFPLPTPVSGVVIEDGTPTTYSSAQQLTETIGSSNKARSCTTTYTLRHLERRLETQADSCLINEAVKVLQDGKPVLDMFVKAIANEDIFWRRAE